MASRVQPGDTVPEEMDGYLYYLRHAEGENFPIYCRRKVGTSDEEVLDQNKEAQGHPFIHINLLKESPSKTMLAFTMDVTGDDTFSAYIRTLSYHPSHKTTPGNKWEVIKGVISVEWGDDDSTLFYTAPDQLGRPWRVYRHRLGTDTAEDQLIYEEPDHAFFVGVGKTKDKKFVFITSHSRTTSEVRVLPTSISSTATSLYLIHPRQTGLNYYVDHSANYFYIITNRDGKGDYIVAKIHQDKILHSSASNVERGGKDAATSPPPQSAWEKVLEPTPGTRIEEVDVFNDHIVTYERKDGLPQLRVLSLNDLTSHKVSLPRPVCSLHPGGNGSYYSRKFRFSCSTPVEPECTFDYHIDNRRLELLRVTNIPGYNPNDYECSRLHATSPEDGTPVPLTVFHKKGMDLDGSNPLLLLGYGAYSQTMEAEFFPEHIPLLMRGWVIALAHVRGGGEMGREWYLQGKQLNKKNSFHDFMACARHLHQLRYSRPSLSAAKASSAGGLLLGAVYNMMQQHQQHQQNENKEDSSVLFKAMIMGVPFLDVMMAMMDPTLPLTIHEYDEWGNPTEDERVFRYIRSYDPYLNLMPPSASPSQSCDVLLTTSTLDARVPYWQSAKWVAKMRSFSSSSLAKSREGHNEEGRKKKGGVVLLRVKSATGHAGERGRYNRYKDVAFEYAFLFKSLGLSYSNSNSSSSIAGKRRT
ncbi:Prolyl endopeptidase, variant 2 [Balamuthia mandrillaris]